MKTTFDNLAFLNSLTPNLNQLNKLESERNWAIGFTLALVIPIAFFAYQNYKLKSELAQIKNNNLLPPTSTAAN